MPLIDKILDATSEADLCKHLREYIGTLKNPSSLRSLPENFHDLTAENAEDIEAWYDALRDAPQSQDLSMPLKDIYDHYHAAIRTLRRLGLRRDA